MESRSLGWAVGDKRAKRVGSFGGRLKVVLYSAVYKRKKAQANFGKKHWILEFILFNVPGTAIGDLDSYHFNLIKLECTF